MPKKVARIIFGIAKLFFRGRIAAMKVTKTKGMPFRDRLAGYTVEQIAGAVGCSIATAYDWKNGRREPPAWQQETWLEKIKAIHRNPTP